MVTSVTFRLVTASGPGVWKGGPVSVSILSGGEIRLPIANPQLLRFVAANRPHEGAAGREQAMFASVQEIAVAHCEEVRANAARH